MMCPWAARIGACRLLRLASGVLMDPFQPFERLHHLSRAAPAKVAALRTPRAAKRLRSEGTDNALRRTWSALRSVLVVVCLVPNLIETAVHPHHPVSRRGALQPRQGASTASSRKSSEMLFLVVETRQSEARRARLRAKAVERMSTGTIDYM